MSWLRIDDGFAHHPKVVQLTRSERWTWMELLCYCARYRTDGEVPLGVSEALPKVNGGFLTKCIMLGLIDVDEHERFTVHHWRDFNPRDPTAAERKQRQRERDSHEDVTESSVTQTVTDRDSRVGARARSRPVPSPIHKPLLPSNGSEAPKEGRIEHLEEDILREMPL